MGNKYKESQKRARAERSRLRGILGNNVDDLEMERFWGLPSETIVDMIAEDMRMAMEDCLGTVSE